MKSKASIPSETRVAQQKRYPGSDVLGMEMTTARPMQYPTGANSKVYLPNQTWPDSMCYPSTTKGKG